MTVTWPKCLNPRAREVLDEVMNAPRIVYSGAATRGQWFRNGEPVSWEVAVGNSFPADNAEALRFAIKGLKSDRGGQ